MKAIKKEIVEAINKEIGVNYSAERYRKLESLGVIKITPLDTDSMKERAMFYKEKLSKAEISKSEILDFMDNFMCCSVSELLIYLGKAKCHNVYELDQAIFEILDDIVFNKSNVESYASYTNEPAHYNLEGSTLSVGQDLISYSRLSRCFLPSNRDVSMEDELSKLSAILNIDESRLSCIDKSSHYSILLDGKQIGIWSEDLMNNFYEESLDIYNAEHHDEDFCNECCNKDYCKYKDNTISLNRKLISDELNVPIFSISSLLVALNRKVIYK